MDQSDESADLLAMTTGMARGRDEDWRRFHAVHGPGVFRCLLALAHGDAHLAADATQQAYLRIARHVRPCAEPVMWRSWLRRVARTTFFDLQRRERRFLSFLRRWQDECPPDNDGADAALLERLDVVMAQMDEGDRALLEAKYLRGEPVAVIAARYGLTIKATESRLTRARAALRERFGHGKETEQHVL